MDLTPVFDQLWRTIGWLVPLAITVLILKSAWFKGQLGEGVVRIAAAWRLPTRTYHAFHNVTLETADGTTQIDHIFVSRFGVFVVETKNMKGWIFGSERQAQWTQKIFKKTFRFQNPLRQNYRHVKAVEETLNISPEVIHSVVVFAGDSTFKTPMPANVTKRGGYISYIRSFQDPVLSETEVMAISSLIECRRLKPSWKTQRRHVRQTRERHSDNAKLSARQRRQ
ncbi:nuclease-related domain-containing protein [Alloalcanivorax dieselolei]|uniref:nuclease-related domain-containing protein n=1 Tax=Alloalcanivorax dieselolei TaxID=285091 RepID=UPI000A2F372D|nr:nuclease-related domain-containing protein [Alloalcanivorax dieselolei]